jgi:hypothetical protein
VGKIVGADEGVGGGVAVAAEVAVGGIAVGKILLQLRTRKLTRRKRRGVRKICSNLFMSQNCEFTR